MHLSPMMFNSSPEDVCMVSKPFFFNFAIILSLFLEICVITFFTFS